jgi:hypothetical protein
MTTPVLFPTTDLVASVWIASIPGLSAAMVGPTLPKDVTKWADGFVQVMVVGGSPSLYLPVAQPVVSVDCWACKPSSDKAPWGRANYLAELIRSATYDHSTVQRTLTLPGTYPEARCLAVNPLTEPRRVYSDDAGYARFNFDLAFSWIKL